jgi:hypothetical protein
MVPQPISAETRHRDAPRPPILLATTSGDAFESARIRSQTSRMTDSTSSLAPCTMFDYLPT